MNPIAAIALGIGLGYVAAELFDAIDVALSPPAKPRRKPVPNTEPLSKEKRRAVWERDEGRCMYCGTRVPFERTHIDHRNPRALGGSNRMQNLATACAACNLKKGAMTARQFMRANGFA